MDVLAVSNVSRTNASRQCSLPFFKKKIAYASLSSETPLHWWVVTKNNLMIPWLEEDVRMSVNIIFKASKS